jgi:hypothetical protein
MSLVDKKICRQLRRLQYLFGALTPSFARLRMGLDDAAIVQTGEMVDTRSGRWWTLFNRV